MGSRECFVGSSHCNPGRRVPMAQQCHQSAERRRCGISPFTAEAVAVVEAVGLRCFLRVRGRETRPSLQLNL